MSGTVAVLDVGKTHTKLTLLDAEGRILKRAARENRLVGQGYFLDTDRIAAWLRATLGTFARTAEINAIVPVAHGAAAALLQGDRAFPVLDYECAPPADIIDAYRAVRDPFARTLSPALPNGLNLGLQFYWQEQELGPFSKAGLCALPWPQYWAYWLSGARASEVTSLGCHTDLWFPEKKDFSALAKARGWDGVFAPLKPAGEVIGNIRPDLAAETGLPRGCEILCGVHDSNASLNAARGAFRDQAFALVSTGTWFVMFQSGGERKVRLDPDRDTLGNVDVEGKVVRSARFMGGREHLAILGDALGASATAADVERAIARGARTFPSFVAGSGPFPAARGRILGTVETASERAGLAAVHLALMTRASLRLIGAEGPVLVEGRFADDPVFTAALARLLAGPLYRYEHGDGVAVGAARLRVPAAARGTLGLVEPLPVDLSAYGERWERAASELRA
jgi:sugar (pentulose or hexulose) kinase